MVQERGEIKMKKIKTLEKTDRRRHQGGFTLVETLVSWTLVVVGLIFACRVIVFSLDGLKKSRIRLEISQEVESCKTRLLSKPFHSPELAEGFARMEDGVFIIDRYISSISPTLKEIKLVISYKILTRTIIFYKSKFIKEVKNDQRI